MKTTSTTNSADLRKADEICTINLFLTKNMFGEKMKNIYSMTANAIDATSAVWDAVKKFKEDCMKSSEFRAVPYDRIIFNGPSCSFDRLVPGCKLAIDFGDYDYFLLIEVIDTEKLKA